MFRAGLCNRLDRNTSGLILAGKTVAATQQLSELIAERAVGKYYLTVVKGTVTETERIRGYLTKNERTNRVSIQREQQGDAVYIETAYRPLCAGSLEDSLCCSCPYHSLPGFCLQFTNKVE